MNKISLRLVLRVQLNDQLLLDILGNICALGLVEKLTRLAVFVPLNPRILAVVETSECIGNHLERLGLLADGDNLAGFYTIGSDINNLSINGDVLVVDKLTSCCASGSDTEAVNDVVKATLEVLEENLTSNATGSGSLVEHVAELLFENTIGVLGLLLLSEHDTILRSLATTRVAVLSRREVALRENFIGTENCLTEATGDTRLRTCISCHIFLFLKILGCVDYTLLLFGGRQPLWGSGVTSTISTTSIPAPWQARIADSRPLPGPLT